MQKGSSETDIFTLTHMVCLRITSYIVYEILKGESFIFKRVNLCFSHPLYIPALYCLFVHAYSKYVNIDRYNMQSLRAYVCFLCLS